MLAAPPPLSGHHLIHGPKAGRRPLQPRNQSATIINHLKPTECVQIFQFDSSNKENIPPFYAPPVKTEESPPIDAPLADELNEIREKLERLRMDRGKTDILLRERGRILDLEMKELVNRGEVQKELEIEVDRLYRLKEIRLASMRISRIRSLRDKEEEKKMKLDQLKKAHMNPHKSPLQSHNAEAQWENESKPLMSMASDMGRPT